MVKVTAAKPRGKTTVRASARIVSRKAVDPPPAGSGVYVGDLMMEILQAKYDGLNLQMQARSGASISEEDMRRVQEKHDACLLAFTNGAALSADAASILSAFDREDMRLIMAVESRQDFESRERDQNRVIEEYQETNIVDSESDEALRGMRDELRNIQHKRNYRISEIVAILRGDGLDPTLWSGPEIRKGAAPDDDRDVEEDMSLGQSHFDASAMVVVAAATAQAGAPVETGPTGAAGATASVTTGLAPVMARAGSLVPSGATVTARAGGPAVLATAMSSAAGAGTASVRINAAANVAAAGTPLRSSAPSMFSGSAIASGYDYLFEHKELEVPDVHYPESRFLDRIQVSALQPSMLAPVLVFKAGEDVHWAYLQPLVAAVYAVIPDGNDGVTNLMLVYTEQAYSDWDTYPRCLSFPCDGGLGSLSILVYSDLAIKTQAIESCIRTAIEKAGFYHPIAPSTPSSSRVGATVPVGANGYAVEKTSGKNTAEWVPLRRAVHGDKSKIAFFTRGDPDAKITGNAAVLTRIRNLGHGTTRITSLPVMQGPLLAKLLMMHFCVIIDFVGAGASRTPDALHICMFMDSPTPGTYFKFSESREIILMFENMEKVCMNIFQEKYGDPYPHFSRCFVGIKDALQDDEPSTSIRHCNINYQVWRVEQLVVEWAALYSNEDYASMGREDFLALNLQTLSINKKEWRKDHGEYDKSRIPAQTVAPPGVGRVAGDEGKVGKYTRAEKRAYSRAGAYHQGENAQVRAANQPGAPGALGAGRGAAGGRGRGRGAGGAPYVAPHAPVVPAVVVPLRLGNGAGRGARGSAGICLRDTLHARDPATFPVSCMVEQDTGVACRHRHGVVLTSGGKFNPADKAAALSSMKNMHGEFATAARAYIENNM